MSEFDTNKWDAEQYEYSSIIQQYHTNKVLKEYHFDDGKQILDIGCGDGRVTARLAQSLPDSTLLGIDRNENMINYAKQHHSDLNNLSFEVQDVLTLDKAGLFDYVISFFCLQWVEDQAQMLTQVKKALKPSGQIMFVLPNNDVIVNPLATDAANRYIDQASVDHYEIPAYFFTDDQYVQFLKTVGLEIDSVDSIYQPVPLANIDVFRKFIEALPLFDHCFPPDVIPTINNEMVKQFDQTCQRDAEGRLIFDSTIQLIKAHKTSS